MRRAEEENEKETNLWKSLAKSEHFSDFIFAARDDSW